MHQPADNTGEYFNRENEVRDLECNVPADVHDNTNKKTHAIAKRQQTENQGLFLPIYFIKRGILHSFK